jgi:predicted cobalt transporter CbtA
MSGARRVCYPALSATAVVMIHRMLFRKKGVLSPALPCMLAAVVIHRMLWWKKGVLRLRCHASSLLSDPRMLWWKE